VLRRETEGSEVNRARKLKKKGFTRERKNPSCLRRGRRKGATNLDRR